VRIHTLLRIFIQHITDLNLFPSKSPPTDLMEVRTQRSVSLLGYSSPLLTCRSPFFFSTHRLPESPRQSLSELLISAITTSCTSNMRKLWHVHARWYRWIHHVHRSVSAGPSSSQQLWEQRLFHLPSTSCTVPAGTICNFDTSRAVLFYQLCEQCHHTCSIVQIADWYTHLVVHLFYKRTFF
jgi:hypothetical protein